MVLARTRELPLNILCIVSWSVPSPIEHRCPSPWARVVRRLLWTNRYRVTRLVPDVARPHRLVPPSHSVDSLGGRITKSTWTEGSRSSEKAFRHIIPRLFVRLKREGAGPRRHINLPLKLLLTIRSLRAVEQPISLRCSEIGTTLFYPATRVGEIQTTL